MQYSSKLTITGLTSNRMKTAIVLCFFAVVAFAAARPEDTYTDKYDGVDLDELLTNDKLLAAYKDCLLGVAKCTPDGKELKSHVSEALSNKCAKCNDKQKEGAKKVISFFINHKPEHWEELKAKFDPEGKYSKKYEEELKEIKA